MTLIKLDDVKEVEKRVDWWEHYSLNNLEATRVHGHLSEREYQRKRDEELTVFTKLRVILREALEARE